MDDHIISNVYADPRGKVGRDGLQEHCFNVISQTPTGRRVDVHRYDCEEAAVAAREEFTGETI